MIWAKKNKNFCIYRKKVLLLHIKIDIGEVNSITLIITIKIY